MAEAVLGALAAGIIPIIFQGMKSLRDAAGDRRNATSSLRKLNQMVQHLETSAQRARRDHSGILHNEPFRRRLEHLDEMILGFKVDVNKAAKVAKRRSLKWPFQWCCFATANDQFLQIAYMMENRLLEWLEVDKVSENISQALERYAQGLPSYLTLQPEDGYQALNSKVEHLCDHLQNITRKAVLVYGFSGIGKSSLAHYVASSCLPERFTDGATKIWLGHGSSLLGCGNVVEYHKMLRDKITHLLKAELGYKKHQIDEVSLDAAFMLLEETLAGKSYLVIVDDVWEQDIVDRFMKLRGNECKYLFTSRVMFSNLVDKVEITKDDIKPVGRAILHHHSQVKTLPVLEDMLLERCGYHPLTITVLGQALEGETREEQWLQAINELRIYANQPNVFGSLEFSLKAMGRNSRDLFTSLASLSWVEPIPEACLEEVWRSLQQDNTTFRMEIRALLRGSLIGKQKPSYSYVVHDMVGLYLDGKQDEALKLLTFQGLFSFSLVAPWLFRYGNLRSKKEAHDVLVRLVSAMETGNDALQGRVFDEIVNVCSTCRKYQDWLSTSQGFVQLLLPYVPKMLTELPLGGKTSEQVIRYITNCYSEKDLEMTSQSLSPAILMHIRPLLRTDSESLKSMVDVVGKLAVALASDDGISQEVLLDIPVKELVHLMDPSSPHKRNFVGTSVVKALINIAKSGKLAAVKVMFEAGLGEAIVRQVKSDFKELSGSGVVKELSMLREHFGEGGKLILEGFSSSIFSDQLSKLEQFSLFGDFLP